MGRACVLSSPTTAQQHAVCVATRHAAAAIRGMAPAPPACRRRRHHQYPAHATAGDAGTATDPTRCFPRRRPAPSSPSSCSLPRASAAGSASQVTRALLARPRVCARGRGSACALRVGVAKVALVHACSRLPWCPSHAAVWHVQRSDASTTAAAALRPRGAMPQPGGGGGPRFRVVQPTCTWF